MGNVECKNGSQWAEGRRSCVKNIQDSVSNPTAVYNPDAVLSTGIIGDTKRISLRTNPEGKEVSITQPIDPKKGIESNTGVYCTGTWNEDTRSYTGTWQDSSGTVGNNIDPTSGLISKTGGDDDGQSWIFNWPHYALIIVATILIVIAFVADSYELKFIGFTAVGCLLLSTVLYKLSFRQNRLPMV